MTDYPIDQPLPRPSEDGQFNIRFTEKDEPEPGTVPDLSEGIEVDPTPMISGNLSVVDSQRGIGQEVEPFTMQRVASLLSDNDYNYNFDKETNTIFSSFNNVGFTFSTHDDRVLLLRGQKVVEGVSAYDEETTSRIKQAVHDLNSQRFIPTVVIEESDNQIVLCCDTFYDTGHGISYGQLDSFIDLSIYHSIEAISWITNNY